MSAQRQLTPTQRKVLWLMNKYDHGPTMITGGTRSFGWHPAAADGPGAIVIYAYMEPDLFLARRGLIERIETSGRGRWYRITPEGRERASKMLKDPTVG